MAKLKITVDYRERTSGIIDFFDREDVSVEIKKVSYGDYIINDAVTVERKTARDFLISIVDLRLFSQLSHLKKHTANPILLIEGNPYKTDLKFDRMAIRGALLSVKTVWCVPVIYSRSVEDTATILTMIGRQHQRHGDAVTLRGGYRPKRLRSKQLYLLQGLPGAGPTLAGRLMEHFRSAANVMNASVQELTAVDGIGKVSAEKIREVLDAKIKS